jgi:sulfate adenylyltransferase subunit 1 (EFTu-like GTPase family)
MPISAQTGMGVKDRIPADVCPWYQGPSLLEYLDSMTALERKVNAPFMMPIASKYRDLGTMVEGKVRVLKAPNGLSSCKVDRGGRYQEGRYISRKSVSHIAATFSPKIS